MKNKLLNSRLLRERLEKFLNFPRAGLEVCGGDQPHPFGAGIGNAYAGAFAAGSSASSRANFSSQGKIEPLATPSKNARSATSHLRSASSSRFARLR